MEKMGNMYEQNFSVINRNYKKELNKGWFYG